MKQFIAICIFAIGLMVALPSTASRSGSNSTPGQISYVVEQPTIAPAIVFALVPANFIFVANNQLAPIAIAVKEEGGRSNEYSLITTQMICYNGLRNLTATVPTKMIMNIDFRLCYTIDVNYRNQNYKLIQSQRNKDWVSQVRIRSDTSI